MSSSQPSSSDGPKKAKKWDYRTTNELLKILVKHHKDGHWENGSFMKIAWNDIDKEFVTATGLPYTHNQILNRWKELKRKHTLYAQLLSKSRWGMDPKTSCPVAPSPYVWTEVLMPTFVEYIKQVMDLVPSLKFTLPLYM
jgi:hypothetical protein